MTSSNHPVPVLRRVAAALLALQVVTVVINVLLIVSGLFREGADTEVAVVVSAIGLLLAVALGLACRALWAGKTWPRGLVTTWQVLLAVVMISNLLSGWSVIDLITLVVALACGTAVIMDLRQEQSAGAAEAADQPHS